MIRERGDTIVEVLLCLAICGLVLGTSYASASRNIKGIRTTQERGEALKIAEGQLESLRGNGYSSPTGSFCIKDSPAGAITDKIGFGSAVPANAAGDPFTGYPAECKRGSIPYYVGVVGTSNVVNNTVEYKTTVRWDSLSGGKNEVQLFYVLAAGP